MIIANVIVFQMKIDNRSGHRRMIRKLVLNVGPVDYTAVAGSGNVIAVNRLITPVRWLKILQLRVVSLQSPWNRTF